MKKNSISDIIKFVKQGSGSLIKDVKIFDVYYQTDTVDTYALSLTLKMEDSKQTLTEVVINNVIEKVISNLNKKLNKP